MTTVGIVGIGEMGGAFVERLLDGGRTVVGWNRTKAKAEGLIANAALAAVTDGDDGILAGIADKLWVEVSTIAADDVRTLHDRVAPAGGGEAAAVAEPPADGNA